MAGSLFPALEADLILAAKGQDKTRVTLNGYYRPPFGRLGAALDQAVMHRIASATIHALLHGVADALTSPEHASAVA
jgi:hypothetical protein